MRTLRILALAVITALTLAACSDSPDSVDDAVDSVQGAADSLADNDDLVEVAEEVRSEMNEFADEVQNSEAAADIQAAWSSVQIEMSEALSSVAAGDEIDRDAIETELETFQSELEAMGDDIGDELMSAWNELRSEFEQLLS